MGRHSIPDPEDSSEAGPGTGDDEPDTPYADRYPPYHPDDDVAEDYDTGYDDRDVEDGEYDEPGYDHPADPHEEHLEEQEAATTAFPTTSGAANGRDWESSEWTGSHRAIAPKRRGLSVSVIVALVTVVVVVGAVIAWRFFGDALSERSQAGAARCVNGEVAVAVVVDPSIADQITPLAEQYNQSAAPVGDKCVKVGVK